MSTRKSFAWAFAGQFLSFAIQFVSSILLARLLSPHEMGIFAIAVATLGVIQIFAAFGVNAYIVKEVELSAATVDCAFTVNAILAVLLASVMLAISFGGSAIFGDPAAGRVLRVLALSPLIGIFGFRPSTMLQREMQFKLIAAIGVAAAIISGAVTVTAAYYGQSYMSPAYGGVAAALVSTIAFAVMAPRHFSFRLSLSGWREMAIFGFRIMSISGVAVLGTRLQDVVLGRLVGLSALGLYSRASNISNNIFDNLYGTGTRVMFTKLAKDFRERGELREAFLKAFEMITALMWPMQVGLAILSAPAILLLYGAKWLPAALPLSLLMIAQVLTLSFGMNWELFVLRGETARQTKLEIVRTLVGFVFFVIGCRFGLAAAAASTIVSCSVGLVLYFPHMHRLAQAGVGQIVRIYRRSATLTVVAATPSLIVMIVNQWSPHTPILLIATAVLLGILLWSATLALLKHPLFEEFTSFRRRYLGGGLSA